MEFVERIRVIVETVFEGSGIKKMNADLKTLNKWYTNVEKVTDKTDNTMQDLNFTLSKSKGAMLGVLFFGMALQRTFSGMLQPVADLYGVFDLWSLMLTVTFMPIMNKVYPIFLDIFNAVLAMPEPLQETFGWIVLLGIGIGGTLEKVGMFALGLSALGIELAVAGVLSLVLVGAFLMLYGAINKNISTGERLGIIIAGFGIGIIAVVGWIGLLVAAVGVGVYLISKNWGKIAYYWDDMWVSMKIKFMDFTIFFFDALRLIEKPFVAIGKLFGQDWSSSMLSDSTRNALVSLKENLKMEKNAMAFEQKMLEMRDTTAKSTKKISDDVKTTTDTMSKSWEGMFENNIMNTNDATKEILKAMEQIPTKITTIHEIVEQSVKKAGGTSGGYTYSNLGFTSANPFLNTNPNFPIAQSYVTVNNNMSVNVSDKYEFSRLLAEYSRKQANDLKSMVKA